ncbi:MAG: hypothetical protein GXO22_05655 [Aquificae bacterium]|nr:hypothetical protein [Aquificota bacterium]
MVRSFLVLFLVFVNLCYADWIEDRVHFILSSNSYKEGYLIYAKRFDSFEIVSLNLRKSEESPRFTVRSFVLKDGLILAEIEGVPVKVTDKHIYFYDRYSFFKFSLDKETVKKEKRLYAGFFKRIHRENLIILDGVDIHLKGRTVAIDHHAIKIPLPEYINISVLNFEYCNGNLLGIFQLRDGSTAFYLIDIQKGQISNKMVLPKEKMVGFFACINDKLLVYRKGLKFLDWNHKFYKLTLYRLY